MLLSVAKWPRHGLKILSAWIVVGIAASAWQFSVDGVSPTLPMTSESAYDLITHHIPSMYTTIHLMPVYGVGMILGAVLVQQGMQLKAIPLLYALPLLHLGTIALMLPGLMYWSGQFVFGPSYEIVYAAVIRTIAAAVFAAGFYLLFGLRHALVIKIARSRLMTVAARLSFAWFLTHPFHIIFMIASGNVVRLSIPLLIIECNFILVTSLLSAILLHVLVEAPVAQLVSLLLKSTGGQPAVTPDADDDMKHKREEKVK